MALAIIMRRVATIWAITLVGVTKILAMTMRVLYQVLTMNIRGLVIFSVPRARSIKVLRKVITTGPRVGPRVGVVWVVMPVHGWGRTD